MLKFYILSVTGGKPVPLEKILNQADQQMKYDPEAGNEKIREKLEDDLENLGG